MKQTKLIEAYQLSEFCQLVEPLLKDGWSFDFESNQHFPTSYGSFYNATLVKDEDSVSESEPSEAPKKAGRKPKSISE